MVSLKRLHVSAYQSVFFPAVVPIYIGRKVKLMLPNVNTYQEMYDTHSNSALIFETNVKMCVYITHFKKPASVNWLQFGGVRAATKVGWKVIFSENGFWYKLGIPVKLGKNPSPHKMCSCLDHYHLILMHMIPVEVT